ncbi:MAG: SMP-30/gluconolactonase/LRE family protein [Actinomycetota bacterium]
MIAALASIAPASAAPFPDHLPLPVGFQPEGIVIGEGTTFYVGSIPTGDLWRGDLETGDGVRLEVPEGRRAIGLAIDDLQRVFVAGGPTGQAYVYDGGTGESLAAYQLADAPTFINDVEVTAGGAWFSDSQNAVLYRVPIAADGTLGSPEDVEALDVTGDFQMQEGFNLNGIEATPDGSTLIVVQSNTGKLFSVDPGSGEADEIELEGGNVQFGDGLLLHKRALFVVQNQLNQVAVVVLAKDLGSGRIIRRLHDSDMDVPTTIDRFGPRLYVVNARFGVDDPENASYTVEQIPTR